MIEEVISFAALKKQTEYRAYTHTQGLDAHYYIYALPFIITKVG
jgi:hypothetical protein